MGEEVENEQCNKEFYFLREERINFFKDKEDFKENGLAKLENRREALTSE